MAGIVDRRTVDNVNPFTAALQTRHIEALHLKDLHIVPQDESTHLFKTRLWAPDPWSNRDTGLFYEGLSKYGEDLEKLRILFPERGRRSIQAKYKVELRFRPERVKMALKAHRAERV